MDNALDRLVIVRVVDRYDRPLAGATVDFAVAGTSAGRVDTGEGGDATLQLPAGAGQVMVNVTFGSMTETALLGANSNFHRFKLKTGAPPMNNYVSAGIGLVVIAAGVVLAFTFPDPEPLQARIIMVLISLGGGGIAAAIPGFLRIDMNLWGKVVIGGAGALGVFLVLFFFDPIETLNNGSGAAGSPEPPTAIAPATQ